MRILTVAVTAVITPMLGLLLAAPPGYARVDEPTVITTAVSDRDDTAGRLDLVRLRHRLVETARGARVEYRLRTQSRFADGLLGRRHRMFVIELDTDGRRGAERNITVYSTRGDLRADLISNATRRVIHPVRVERRSSRVLELRGRRDLVGARKYFWTSNFHRPTSPACGWGDGYRITCQDSVPDDGWLRLDRLGWPSAN